MSADPLRELDVVPGAPSTHKDSADSARPAAGVAETLPPQGPVAPETAPTLAPGETADTLPPGVLPEEVPGYELLCELGRGGMGVVYKARQRALHRHVALKMIIAGEYANAQACVRFLSEAEAIARLHHPNIIQIYELGRHKNVPFFSLELLEGGSLDRILDGRPQAPAEAARKIEILARAMQTAHQQGVVHRDLKPG
ncbi:MAG: serine/threonine-protein kinase, partial [Gemmataceae bacterium]